MCESIRRAGPSRSATIIQRPLGCKLEVSVTTRLVSLGNGVDLAYDVLGTLSQPVVMPILGITDNLSDWPDRLCVPFVDAGYCVVRHECRDMGWSTQMDGAQYGMEHIVDDVIALMDHLEIGAANFIGYSFRRRHCAIARPRRSQPSAKFGLIAEH